MDDAQGATAKQLLKAGIQAAKAGNKQTAQVIFQQVLDQDKRNERALFWMASVADTLEEKQRYLRATLKVNPHNQKAKRHLKRLEKTSSERDSRIVTYGLLVAIALVILFVIAIIFVVIIT